MNVRILSLVSLMGIFLQCQVALSFEQTCTETICTIDALDAIFDETQDQYLPVSPPSWDAYIHAPDIVIPVDWQMFPDEFIENMYAYMDKR